MSSMPEPLKYFFSYLEKHPPEITPASPTAGQNSRAILCVIRLLLKLIILLLFISLQLMDIAVIEAEPFEWNTRVVT